MKRDIQRTSFWRRCGGYAVGAGLSYVGTFGINFIGGSTNLTARVAWALVWGTIMWPFFVAAQFFIQWVIRKLMGPRLDGSFPKQLLVLNFPIAILVAALLGYQCVISSPRNAFEHLIAKPIPASVRSIEQGNFRTMDNVLRVLHFEISKPDLVKLLDEQRFTPINQEEEFKRWDIHVKDYIWITKGEYLKRWEQYIRESVKLNVNLTKDWQIHTLKENGGKKYIFSDTNSMEVVFIAEAH